MANTTFSGPVRSENGFKTIVQERDHRRDYRHDHADSVRHDLRDRRHRRHRRQHACAQHCKRWHDLRVHRYDCRWCRHNGNLRAPRRWCVELLRRVGTARRCGSKPRKRRCWRHADAGQLDRGQQPRETDLHFGRWHQLDLEGRSPFEPDRNHRIRGKTWPVLT
jgi:hypothetical protein